MNLNPNVPTLEIKQNGSAKPLVRLWHDGRIEFGDDYTPDEAARVFWEAMAEYFPTERRRRPAEHVVVKGWVCPNCAETRLLGTLSVAAGTRVTCRCGFEHEFTSEHPDPEMGDY